MILREPKVPLEAGWQLVETTLTERSSSQSWRKGLLRVLSTYRPLEVPGSDPVMAWLLRVSERGRCPPAASLQAALGAFGWPVPGGAGVVQRVLSSCHSEVLALVDQDITAAQR